MIQAEEKLNKAKKLAASLGVSLSDLADVVSVLQEVGDSNSFLHVDDFLTVDNVMQSLVDAGKIARSEIEEIDAKIAIQHRIFKNLMSSVQAHVSLHKTEQGLSVRQLAENFGMASRHMQNLLKGEGNPTLHTISEIAAQSGKKVRLVFE